MHSLLHRLVGKYEKPFQYILQRGMFEVNKISSQNFRIFPELTPLPNSIFQDIFQVKKNFRTFLELLKFSGRVDTLLKAPLTYTFSNSAAAEKLSNPAGIYLFKVNKKKTTTRCEICSELTIKTPE